MAEPRVSVVIPVYNGAKTIARTIERLFEQTLRPCEIVIVDDGSTDGTADALARFGERIRVVRKANGGPASARNAGVRAAEGAFIAFTDSDCLPDQDWLRHLLAGFDREELAGVGGIVRGVDATLTGQYVDAIRLLDPQADETGEIPYLITANACFRREALLRAGLFDERFRKPGGEEPELCARIRRLGYRFAAAESAVVLHHHRQTPGSLFRTLTNYGEGLFLFSQISPEHRIERPWRVLLRRAVALRSIFTRVGVYAGAYGLSRGVYFSVLDYLRQLAMIRGYLRASRRGV
ncbi:MAG: glycosyltransferase [Blastocatellia bacterium]|nr:glycosyltransferase [Blastocatellia bacterium]